MVSQVICPHCKSIVVPLTQPNGQPLCPVCQNTGLRAAPAPVAWSPIGVQQENAPGAVAALVLGIVTFVPYVGLVTGWIAIYLGNKALRLARQEPGRYGGTGMAQAGRILGIVGLCLFALTIIFAAIVFVLVSNLSRNIGHNGTASP